MLHFMLYAQGFNYKLSIKYRVTLCITFLHIKIEESRQSKYVFPKIKDKAVKAR